MLFHWEPWEALSGKRVALTTDSATSVKLLEVLLHASHLTPEFIPMKPDLDAMLMACDAALLIGDSALKEAGGAATGGGASALCYRLGPRLVRPHAVALYLLRCGLPDETRRPQSGWWPSLRAARERGLGHLAAGGGR